MALNIDDEFVLLMRVMDNQQHARTAVGKRIAAADETIERVEMSPEQMAAQYEYMVAQERAKDPHYGLSIARRRLIELQAALDVPAEARRERKIN